MLLLTRLCVTDFIFLSYKSEAWKNNSLKGWKHMQVMQMASLASVRDGAWNCKPVSAPGLGICSWCSWVIHLLSPWGTWVFWVAALCLPVWVTLELLVFADPLFGIQLFCSHLWNLCTIFCLRWCFKVPRLTSCVVLAISWGGLITALILSLFCILLFCFSLWILNCY